MEHGQEPLYQKHAESSDSEFFENYGERNDILDEVEGVVTSCLDGIKI